MGMSYKVEKSNYKDYSQLRFQVKNLCVTQLVVSEALAVRWSRKRSFNLYRHRRRHAGCNHGQMKHYGEHGAADFYRQHPEQRHTDRGSESTNEKRTCYINRMGCVYPAYTYDEYEQPQDYMKFLLNTSVNSFNTFTQHNIFLCCFVLRNY